MEDMTQKGIEVEWNQQRFNDLSVNQETGVPDGKSIFEAKGSLQGEGEGMYKDLRLKLTQMLGLILKLLISRLENLSLWTIKV